MQVRYDVRKNESGMVLNELNSDDAVRWRWLHDASLWQCSTLREDEEGILYETWNIWWRYTVTQKLDETWCIVAER